MYKRVAVAFFALMVVFGLLITNLAVVLVQNTDVSESVGTKTETVNVSRGGIYDRNGLPLVNTEKRYITYALPSTEALKQIKPYVNNDDLSNFYNQMSNGKIIKFNSNNIFSSSCVKSVCVVKRYSGENLCPHIIGYLDGDGNGVSGLEKTYDNYLKMTGGEISISWSADAKEHVLLGKELKITETDYPDNGGIVITIDRDFQSAIEKIMKSSDISVGAAVVMDSETAEILTSVSLPAFDSQNVADYLNKENSPFINRADTPFSVGSVFKPIVAATALENGVSVKHYCKGIDFVDGLGFRCNNSVSHGEVTMATAMEKSCNTYFIKLGAQVGGEKLVNLCSSLGLGKSFEYEDGVFSKSGKLPSVESLNAEKALANFSFGQGELLATPWQMAAVYSAIANGGVYHTPVLMKAILGDNKEPIQKLQTDDGVRVLSKQTTQKLDTILSGVVKNGTAKLGNSDRYDGRGKTATAQSGTLKNGREVLHTWFCGYFTYKSKTYTVVIFKEDGTSGANDCAPVFRSVAEKICDIVDERK